MKQELQFKVISVVNSLMRENRELKEENKQLRNRLEDLKDASTESKMMEYDELVTELNKQKKEYIGLVHDVKKLKRRLTNELVRIDEV